MTPSAATADATTATTSSATAIRSAAAARTTASANAGSADRHPAPATRTGLLPAAFGLFNGLRVVAYLPTLAAIASAGQADQHSLFTWLVFLGSNSTMALWLLERNAGRVDRAVLVNAVNALMCAAIAAAIAWQRLPALLR